MRAYLRQGGRASANAYLRAGGLIGSLLGVVAFVLTWAFCIANFGVVFGVAMGWIPAAIAGTLTSFILRPLWGPLLIGSVLLLSAPRWDDGGQMKRVSREVATSGRLALDWTIRTGRRETARLERALRRENLWPTSLDQSSFGP